VIVILLITPVHPCTKQTASHSVQHHWRGMHECDRQTDGRTTLWHLQSQ